MTQARARARSSCNLATAVEGVSPLAGVPGLSGLLGGVSALWQERWGAAAEVAAAAATTMEATEGGSDGTPADAGG